MSASAWPCWTPRSRSQTGVSRGRWSPLAGPEIGAVAPSMTTGWFALTIAVVCLAATGFVGVAGAFVAR